MADFRMPTDGELEILRVLWDRGPSTVREVQEALARTRPTGYTTALKLLQIMLEKNLVTRDDAQRTHVYRAAVEQSNTERHLVGDLVDRVFGGSPAKMVMQALADHRATPEELAQIRALLDDRAGA